MTNEQGELHAGGEVIATGHIEWLNGTSLAIRFHTGPLTDEQRQRIGEGPLELHFTEEGKHRWIPDDGMQADAIPRQAREVFLTSTNDQQWKVEP